MQSGPRVGPRKRMIMKFNRLRSWTRSLTVAAMALGLGGSVRAEGWVVAWGDNSASQCNVPAGLSNDMAVAGGYYHSLAARLHGTVSLWGDTTTPGDLTNIVAVAGGLDCSLVLRADGTVSAWGDNTYGQLNVPVDLTNAIAVSAGWTHGLALRADGSVTAWGWNNYGQATVPVGLSNVLAVAANGNHSLALRADHTVAAWGNSAEGQTAVPPGLDDVVAIAAGLAHSLGYEAMVPWLFGATTLMARGMFHRVWVTCWQLQRGVITALRCGRMERLLPGAATSKARRTRQG